ncbi:hypothetical protein T484DRAFT_3068041 [Baffinella frigidus]|nr:hypothetical protein T484DRAFT_3068041 [Cryptophyta sp. CCMP2293]
MLSSFTLPPLLRRKSPRHPKSTPACAARPLRGYPRTYLPNPPPFYPTNLLSLPRPLSTPKRSPPQHPPGDSRPPPARQRWPRPLWRRRVSQAQVARGTHGSAP